jgi:hypothetical protein
LQVLEQFKDPLLKGNESTFTQVRKLWRINHIRRFGCRLAVSLRAKPSSDQNPRTSLDKAMLPSH